MRLPMLIFVIIKINAFYYLFIIIYFLIGIKVQLVTLRSSKKKLSPIQGHTLNEQKRALK